MPPVRQLNIIPNPLRFVLTLRAEFFDCLLKQFCLDNNYSFISLNLPLEKKLLAIDGFHPSDEFYSVWAQNIADKLYEEGSSLEGLD